MSRFERYEEGSQVTISYGKYSNRILLTNYGFAIADNKFDYARVKFSLKDIFLPEQMANVDKLYEVPMFWAVKFKQNIINMKFLQVLRGVLWQSHLSAKSFFAADSLELEEKVLNKAAKLLDEIIEEYETSLDQDLELLSKPKSSRHYFAV